ncbi:MAG: hypothetical protein K2X47_02750, partial [Bdellovibrionales bacterium]|nr:hypothetical protein [Bdellovibrionales bacterium]
MSRINAPSLFLQIESDVREGRHFLANKKIKQLASLGLTDEIRLRLSDWYLRMGWAHESLRILGAELSEQDLKFASLDQIRLQMRLTYLLSYFEAYRSAARILRKLRPFTEFHQSLMVTFLRSEGALLTRQYEYSQAEKTYRELLKVMNPADDPYTYQLIKIGLADNLDGQGETEAAVAIVDQVLEEALPTQVVLRAIA